MGRLSYKRERESCSRVDSLHPFSLFYLYVCRNELHAVVNRLFQYLDALYRFQCIVFFFIREQTCFERFLIYVLLESSWTNPFEQTFIAWKDFFSFFFFIVKIKAMIIFFYFQV